MLINKNNKKARKEMEVAASRPEITNGLADHDPGRFHIPLRAGWKYVLMSYS
jgi:hypothetical protein